MRDWSRRSGCGEDCVLNPNSAVQSNTAIKRQTLRSENNGPVPCSGLQSPVLQRISGENCHPEASTLDGIEIVRFCVFAPPGSPLDRYTNNLYWRIRTEWPIVGSMFPINIPWRKRAASDAPNFAEASE